MISLNRLATRQLLVRKGRTLLTGAAIALGVASMLSVMILGTSGSAMIERQSRAEFGFADIRAGLDENSDRSRTIEEVSKVQGVRGVALEKWWLLEGDRNGEKTEFLTKAIDPESSVAAELYRLSAGWLPKGKEDLALSASAARELGYKIGQTFPLPLSGETKNLRITGLVDDGPSISSRNIKVYVNLSTLGAILTQNRPGFDSAQVMVESKRMMRKTAQELEKIKGVLDAKSIDVFLEEAGRTANITTTVFGVIGAISLVIGGTLIYTVFAVTAAEREREFALLKALGAERPRLRRLVYREAAVLGLFFSGLGLPLGFAVSFGLLWIGLQTGTFSGFGFADLSLDPLSIFIAIAAGVGTTFISALFPARKVGRTSPLAAIRPQPAEERKVSAWRWIGLALIFGGAAAIIKYSAIPGVESGYVMPPAALAVYLGIAIFMPILVGPLFSLAERLYPGRGRAAGKLAAAYLGRQSTRSARSVTSTLIGVSLVALIALMTATAVASGRLLIEKQVRYDLSIAAPQNMGYPGTGSIPKKTVEAVKKIEGVDLATTVKMGSTKLEMTQAMVKKVQARLKGISDDEVINKISSTPIIALDKNFSRLSGLVFPEGESDERIWTEFSGRSVILRDAFARFFGLKPGDKINLLDKKGKPIEFKVLALTDMFLLGGNLQGGGVFMSQANAKDFKVDADSAILLKLEEDADKAATLDNVKRLVKGTDVEVLTDKQIARKVDGLMEGPNALLYLLFGVTILVSLLGVINTIAIGVLERRREMGLIRAVGATRRQMRSMIFFEATLISLAGVLLGIALSTGAAIFLVKGIDNGGIVVPPFTFPAVTMSALVAMVVVVSILGAILPARLANATTPVEALKFE